MRVNDIYNYLARLSRASLVSVLILALGISALPARYASAATINASPRATVSITFDDGLTSALTQAAPILAAHGLVGTNYIVTGCVGMTAVPNTCLADNNRSYMTWAQIQALQNTYGWEIGSHTATHKCLASNSKQDPEDCQKKTLTAAQVKTELVTSKTTLAANGINATSFAPPYGDYNNSVLAEIAKNYSSMRQFKNASNNTNVWPYSEYYLQDYPAEETTDTVATIQSRIDTAIANNQWLILTFHDIQQSPSSDPMEYQFGATELNQVAAYIQAKQQAGAIRTTNINGGMVSSDVNLLPNGSFNNGLGNGWRTDASSTITADSANNGSYPDSQKAIKLTSVSGSGHLFSPAVSVDPNTTYLFKNFLNVRAVTSGVVAFYVDEYDMNGNWISGQYLKQETSAFVEEMNFAYKPRSQQVSKASLQVIAAGSGLTAYLDNVQMFPLTTVTPPVRTNLLANGTFDGGLNGGWKTNSPATITADNTNQGSPSNPANSIKLTAAAQNAYLFGPVVGVNAAASYDIASYLDLRQISGTGSEVAFYIDEYDMNGNWISGQYKLGVHAVSAGNVGFSYTPSSSKVAKASLQVIVVGNSGILAYVDNMQWYLAG